MHEDSAILKRKVERLKKIEMASDMDEILKEEIREYKETLTCPSCKVKRKDAILTKCFHVFCYDCLRSVIVMMISRCLVLIIFYSGHVTRQGKGSVPSAMLPLEPQTTIDCIYHKFCLCCTNVPMLLTIIIPGILLASLILIIK